MNAYFSDEWLTVYQGDARVVLPELAAESVDCIVTSPPYWGLRDYGTAVWSGGAADCDHAPTGEQVRRAVMGASGLGARHTAQEEAARSRMMPKGICGRCGASRVDSQLGLEPTPELYVANLVGVFRELRRVLKPSGTCWLNLGDSYASGGGSGEQRLDELGVRLGTGGGHKHSSRPSGRAPSAGLAQKQLVGIPWRVAFALQADGWYLRSDIIWSKPNPMPESVTDRPTKAHEYLFLLTKSVRYYFDAAAVAEHATYGPGGWEQNGAGSKLVIPGQGYAQHRPRRSKKRGEFDGKTEAMPGRNAFRAITTTRNVRSVWTIATRPYPGAHFAVFPPELPERCIKAGSSERGVCAKLDCGAPFVRVVERETNWQERKAAGAAAGSLQNGHNASHGKGMTHDLGGGPVRDLGWKATCSHHDLCPHPNLAGPCTVAPVVLDPFAGSGTVGLVANRLSRRAILIDLNADYLRQQMRRNAQTPLGLGA